MEGGVARPIGGIHGRKSRLFSASCWQSSGGYRRAFSVFSLYPKRAAGKRTVDRAECAGD
jgi:hypothetical protein